MMLTDDEFVCVVNTYKEEAAGNALWCVLYMNLISANSLQIPAAGQLGATVTTLG